MATTTILDMHFKPEAVDEARELLKRILAETRAFEAAASTA